MIEKLKQAGFERIAIADDAEKNIYAAKQLEERLPGIQFEFYRRGDLLVAQIPKRYKEIGLILTDKEMETPDAGLEVLQTAWSYHVPAFICSGGYQHGGKPRLRIAPKIESLSLEDGMLKDNPDAWYKILEGIADDATDERSEFRGGKGKLLQALLRARKYSVPFSEFTGEQARRVAQGDLNIQ